MAAQWLYVLDEVVELDLGLSRGKGQEDSMQICLDLPASSSWSRSTLGLPITKATLCPDRAEVIQEPEWKFSPRVPSPLRMTSSP